MGTWMWWWRRTAQYPGKVHYGTVRYGTGACNSARWISTSGRQGADPCLAFQLSQPFQTTGRYQVYKHNGGKRMNLHQARGTLKNQNTGMSGRGTGRVGASIYFMAVSTSRY